MDAAGHCARGSGGLRGRRRALIARASQKRVGKKTAVLIGVAAFALAVVVVILLARTAMPL